MSSGPKIAADEVGELLDGLSREPDFLDAVARHGGFEGFAMPVAEYAPRFQAEVLLPEPNHFGILAGPE
jgi:hypothetical protein